jgi:hypothetical protein
MSYTYPSSFVDTFPNGFNPLSLTNQSYSEADAGSELGGSYYTPPIGGELSHAYPTYNGPSLSQTTPSLPSTSSVESPASWESSSSQTSGFPSDDLSQLFSEPNTTNANPQPVVGQPGTRRRGGSSLRSRRTIGQKIKKPAGMRYAAKLVRSFQTRIGIEILQSHTLLKREVARRNSSRPSWGSTTAARKSTWMTSRPEKNIGVPMNISRTSQNNFITCKLHTFARRFCPCIFLVEMPSKIPPALWHVFTLFIYAFFLSSLFTS